MKITLFLDDKLVEFTLPNQVSGSYGFDVDDDATDKLINVEAREGKWVLYSTDSVFVMNNDTSIANIDIIPNNFYVISKNSKKYLIFVSNIANRDVRSFMIPDDFKISFSGTGDANIIYSKMPIRDLRVDVSRSNNGFVLLTNNTNYLYLNNQHIGENQVYIKYGDVLNIFDIKVIFLKNIMIINYALNSVGFNNFNYKEFTVDLGENQNIVVKDVDLLDNDSYFTKSPRIRRLIEEKTINIDNPPARKESAKTPLIVTLGPMLSLLASSCITLMSTIMQINAGTTTLQNSWPSFATCGVTLFASILWPFVTKIYNNYLEKKSNKDIESKYKIYLDDIEKTLSDEANLQKSILFENNISCTECLNIIKEKKNNFWCKRKDQNDFLNVRIGIGKTPLQVKINIPKDGFSIEDDQLKKLALEIIDKYTELVNVPVGYSLFDNYLTAIMGPSDMCYNFINKIILQLSSFYCYDELKFIIFTNNSNKNNWEYFRYSNYCFSNDKNVRFFASTDDEYADLSNYLLQELQYRLELSASSDFNPRSLKQYYIVICDNYREAKKLDFFKKLVEAPKNIGFSSIFIENKLSNLPSKCVNFITLNKGISGVLNNSYESAVINEFREEISDTFDMKAIMDDLSNVPVEIKDADSQLPNSISFLEMENVGKVEQLNIFNRWNSNNSVKSLRTEIGVDSDGDILYLDLHEKAHGPHGLIAGMTGSGKSEFIITFILSMAMNYSPDDVSFVLIDYKGGGLTGAFLNETNGIRLPHLAGTITNLDKSEMNRTLVSIDSEIKNRQKIFNETKDAMGESTIDIYKYQDYYHQGRVKIPVPHLFIICDEFAELKTQQPEFMDNLISVARIGRSLGVHLILATQKPSGVVNDQIWSNSKFKVCLKVQDTSDSNEMLKKPDAANLKQVGRFYLQVGYDEYYVLGQSAWCGAKYYPSDKPIKKVDKSINFINSVGNIIKSAGYESDKKVNSTCDQISAILNEIVNVSKKTNKVSKMLWKQSIPPIILIDNIIKKYNLTFNPFEIKAIIGEYDAPETQSQGVLTYDLVNDGNTIVYGLDGSENEMLLESIVYSTSIYHSPEELNIYAIDFGSESLRLLSSFPQFGGIVVAGDNERYVNLINMLRDETRRRKDLFINYGGDYNNYLKNSGTKLPVICVLINNYETAKNSISTMYDELPDLIRDSDRYGIVYIMTASSPSGVGQRISQSFANIYALHLKDVYDYYSVFSVRTKTLPGDITGRGICSINGLHEFQTASIIEDSSNLSSYISDISTKMNERWVNKAKRIPSLPEFVSYEEVSEYISDLSNVPVGISKADLDVVKYDFTENIGNLILSNKIDNIHEFSSSLISIFKSMNGVSTLLIDVSKTLENIKDKVNNYYSDNYEQVIVDIGNFLDKYDGNSKIIIMINGLSKLVPKLSSQNILSDFFKKLKNIEKIPLIVFDEAIKLKTYAFDNWFKDMFASQEGIWIGSGVSDQSILKVSTFSKETRTQYRNNMGFYVVNGECILMKILDFDKEGGE